MSGQLDMLDPSAGRAPRERRTDYETARPAWNDATEWDSLALITRARDRLRRLGATDGVVVAGARPTYRSASRPEIETPL